MDIEALNKFADLLTNTGLVAALERIAVAQERLADTAELMLLRESTPTGETASRRKELFRRIIARKL